MLFVEELEEFLAFVVLARRVLFDELFRTQVVLIVLLSHIGKLKL